MAARPPGAYHPFREPPEGCQAACSRSAFGRRKGPSPRSPCSTRRPYAFVARKGGYWAGASRPAFRAPSVAGSGAAFGPLWQATIGRMPRRCKQCGIRLRNEQAASAHAATAHLDQTPSFPPARGGDGADDPEYTGGRRCEALVPEHLPIGRFVRHRPPDAPDWAAPVAPFAAGPWPDLPQAARHAGDLLVIPPFGRAAQPPPQRWL